jgi:tetratricopeptide (TPR) repeat protein
LGNLHILKGEWQSALEYYEKAIQLNTTNPEPYLKAAEASLKLNQKEEARKYYQHLLQINPSNKDALKGLAGIH